MRMCVEQNGALVATQVPSNSHQSLLMLSTGSNRKRANRKFLFFLFSPVIFAFVVFVYVQMFVLSCCCWFFFLARSHRIFDFYSANIFSRPVEPKTWRNECYECFCIQKYTSFCSHWNYSLRFFLAFCVSELELIFFLPCPIVIIVITITVLCAKLRSIYIYSSWRACVHCVWKRESVLSYRN